MAHLIGRQVQHSQFGIGIILKVFDTEDRGIMAIYVQFESRKEMVSYNEVILLH